MSEVSTDTVDQAVAQGGAYEVLRRRLTDQGQKLVGIADSLNGRRVSEFGETKMETLGRVRIRSENNAVGRDIVQVGNMLLFGYNVFLGLKTTTSIKDVFSLYKLVETGDGYDVTPVDYKGTFLDDDAFKRDFAELYSYYKDARLTQLIVRDGKLMAAFQIGQKITDTRVFRWSLSSTGDVSYMDARGDRDILPPPAFDFEWSKATKDMEVSGRFPHLNILGKVFVETTGGDLTIKIDNNTESGQGIFSEPVDDATQSLDDAQVEFAKVGSLILLKVLPYRETKWRGLIYNTLTQKVVRMDAIVQACIQLPEDHGIIFPGGYYLQNGEHKAFDASMASMAYKRNIRSPNGEDVLYIFYERDSGKSALLVYNMVRRQLMPPIMTHGYARLGDGKMVLFNAENDNPTRVHQMQVWNTPFMSDEFAATVPPSTTPLGRIGNAELVRAVSDFYDLAKEMAHEEVSSARYEKLAHETRRMFDVHHWIDDELTGGLSTLLHEVASTSESILDEFEKVQQIRLHSEASLKEAKDKFRALTGRMQPDSWNNTEEFVEALNEITALRGRLLTIRESRYIDVAAIDDMSEQLAQIHDTVGQATGRFMGNPKAIAPLEKRLSDIDAEAQKAQTAKQLSGHVDALSDMSSDLDMLSELMATLKVDDAAERTKVVEAISGLYAKLNQARARAEQRRKSLGSTEAVAQFGAQFALFGQSVASALGMANTPEKADEQLSRLMVQLEELESQFGEFDQFLGDIIEKREELVETFETHKQALLDNRQRQAHSVFEAASRILEGLSRRTDRIKSPDELNAFFIGDALIQKLRDLVTRLRDIKDSVRADDIEAKIKSARDQAMRALRDRSDLFEDGGSVIKLGPRHRFSVNTQSLDLTLLPREDHLALHLTGTDYFEPLLGAGLEEYRPYWSISLESESDALYRGEYLAGQILHAAMQNAEGLSLTRLRKEATDAKALEAIVREFASSRYRDGYEKGIHDHDAALILHDLVALHQQAGVLAAPPASRALALDFWISNSDAKHWVNRVLAARAIDSLGSGGASVVKVQRELQGAIEKQYEHRAFPFEGASFASAAEYLVECIQDESPVLAVSASAKTLSDAIENAFKDGKARTFTAALEHLASSPDAALSLIRQALETIVAQPHLAEHAHFVPEAAVLYLHRKANARTDAKSVSLSSKVKGLLGQHPRIENGVLGLSIDDVLARYQHHVNTFLPSYKAYHALRSKVLGERRNAMRLDTFKARPLTSFVRNRLINEVYLPVIGDNLAKQMGTVGEGKRSDLMGLLMMISPPGYGKTTLMEYVASSLGLVFMKINGPSLGHEVRSLDPEQAPDSTSRQEVEKINLALEMGSNVMLYVDDIQHTHPEFLQKFISLCDGTRRIDGVWQGKTKTYDMRGKKFAVVMAGNPYTESGEVFKIPDMLANRADIYNLGDVLGGMEDVFLMSYIENSMTSNPVLAPMATRDMSDLYLLTDKALGKEVSTNELKHPYSGAEINEIVAILERLIKVRNIVYRVNKQYIASAAQDDRYRTEPPFKLQGSYRNMNKLTEKLSTAMNDAEIQQLISDHYLGESQLLTAGAEENLLKLAELRGVMTDEQKARWEQIKSDFMRNKSMGGADSDVGTRMVAQLADIARGLGSLGAGSKKEDEAKHFEMLAQSIMQAMENRSDAQDTEQARVNEQARWDALTQALLANVDRPIEVKLEGGAPVPVASESEAVSKPKRRALPALAPASPVAQSPISAPIGSNDQIVQIAKVLSEGNEKIIAAMGNRWEDQSLLASALAAIMVRMSDDGSGVDDGGSSVAVGRSKSEFDKILANLVFRYKLDRNR